MTAENGYEPVYFEEARPLARMILPRRIYIHDGGRCFQTRPDEPAFDLLWTELSEMLQELADPGYYYCREGLPPEAERCLTLLFEPHLPLGPESVWLRRGHHEELAGIQIWRSGERCWAILEEDEETDAVLLLPTGWGAQLAGLDDRFDLGAMQCCEELPAGGLRLSRGSLINVAAPLYVPVGVSGMERYSLKPEQLEGELLLKTFFINRNLVREIKEKDGGLIYTDGEQGLRLGDGLDYSHPFVERKAGELSYTAALLAAGRLLSYHGGWVEHLRLESLIQGEQDGAPSGGLYSVQWRSYIDGYPLMGDSGVVMRYHHGGLQSYRRNLHEPAGPPAEVVAVGDYREALQAAVLMLEKETPEQPLLEEMDLAYCREGNRAVPVWLIRLDGRVLLLKTDELVPPEGWER